MKRLTIAALVVWTCLVPGSATAYHMTCGDFAFFIDVPLDYCEDSNDDGVTDAEGYGIARGAVEGINDTLAALLCLGRHPACQCTQFVLFDHFDEYFDIFFPELEICLDRNPDDSIIGPALKAAQEVCNF